MGIVNERHSPPSIPRLRCLWARHWTPNCSPGAGGMAAHCSGCVFTVCVFTTHCCVCALGWVKCRAPISSMGHHTWQYITLYYTVKIKTWNMIFPKNDKLFYFLLLVNVLFVCAINKDLLSVYYLCIISHNSLRSHHIHLRLKLITQLKPYVFRSSLSIIIHCTPPQTLSPHAWPLLHLLRTEDAVLTWLQGSSKSDITSCNNKPDPIT